MSNYAPVQQTGNGTSQNFTVPWPYLDPSHVTVTVNGSPVPFTWLDAGTVRITTPPAAGSRIIIRRDTPSSVQVEYQSGFLRTEDLNYAYKHPLFVADEQGPNTELDRPDNSILNADLADMATGSIKGRASPGTGDPEDLSVAQVKNLLALSPADISGFNESVDDRVAALLTAGANTVLTYDDAAHKLTIASIGGGGGGGGGLTDGNFGDIVVSAMGTVLTVGAGVVTNDKLASAPTGTIKGRVDAGSGPVTDLTADQVRTLLALTIADVSGLSTALAGKSGTGHTHIRADITDLVSATAAVQGIVELATNAETLTGTDTVRAATPDSVAALWEQGLNIASAATITIGDGGYFVVTGTTAITAINITAGRIGRLFRLRFVAALTLTHNATSLILPGGANITTAVGDHALFVVRSGGVECVDYHRADGRALVSSGNGGPLFTASTPSTSGTAIDFVGIPATVNKITIQFSSVSINATVNIVIRGGTASGIESSGYQGAISLATPVMSVASVASGFIVSPTGIPHDFHGHITLVRRPGTNLWTAVGTFSRGTLNEIILIAGSKTFAGVLDRIQVTSANGTSAFNGGVISVIGEA